MDRHVEADAGSHFIMVHRETVQDDPVAFRMIFPRSASQLTQIKAWRSDSS